MLVQSKSLDDLLLLLEVWKPGKLPSELLTYYAPELRRRWHVTPADLYAFDLAATARWADLQQEQQEHQNRREKSASAKQPQRSLGAPGAVRENGDQLAIRGMEIPPWDARYKRAHAR